MKNFTLLQKFMSWSSEQQEEWYNSATVEQQLELCDIMRDYEIWLDRQSLLVSFDETTANTH